MKTKTKLYKNKTTNGVRRSSGFSSSQGGIMPVSGFDPLNNKVSVKNGKSQQLLGGGVPADLFGVVGAVSGSIVGSMSGNPYVVGLAAYTGGAARHTVAKLIGLGNKSSKNVSRLNGMAGKGLGFVNSAHSLVDFIR